MENVFSMYLQAGLFGSCLILVVLLLRLVLKKAPKNILCVLWLVVTLRLLLPFQIESPLSMQPAEIYNVVPTQSQSVEVEQDLAAPPAPITEGKIFPIRIASVVWLSGAGGILLYAAVCYLRLHHKVLKNAENHNGLWINDHIGNAFLLGYLRPRIVLPAGLSESEREFVLAHERAHLARGDHWWKLLGYMGIALHWYNPLVWLGYSLMSRDIEFACDQRVIRDMDLKSRKAYSTALLNSGTMGFGYTSIPVSFAEVSLKKRIKNVLGYRKSAFWISGAAVLAVVVACVCFLTVPRQPEDPPKASLEQPAEPKLTEEEIPEPTATEPATEPVTEPATEPATEPVTQPTTEPVVTQPPVQQQPSEPSDEEYVYNGEYDLAALDRKLTAYAARLGFQTMDSHPNTNVACYHYYSYSPSYDAMFEQELYAYGYSKVDAAYSKCVEQGAVIENSLIWVNTLYDGLWDTYHIYVYCAAAY